jgi:tRNA(fMet)-specific endonuclease VapC
LESQIVCATRRSGRKQKGFFRPLTVFSLYEVLDVYANEKVRLRRLGQPISDFDLLIGATAIHYGLILVTNNVKHFERMKGLSIENWTTQVK